MKLASLSASSANVYELCPARWKAEYQERVPSMSGSAASLGTACHTVLERWVADKHHMAGYDDATKRKVITELYRDAYWNVFADRERYDEGLELVLRWEARQDFSKREVLSTETKRNVPLKTSIGTIPFNFIFDREDRLGPTEIEVVDYKSISFPVPPEELRNRIQARAYAMAVYMEHPEVERVWVTFDLLRYDAVGVVFTRDECRDTYRYLRHLAERIIADQTAEETLNRECRWCLRKASCETLMKHVKGEGPLVISTPEEAAKRRYELDQVAQALKTQITDLDVFLLEHLEKSDASEVDLDRLHVEVSSSRRRKVNSPVAVGRLIGPDAALGISTMSVTGLDDLLKTGTYDDETMSLIRQQIHWYRTKAGIKITPLSAE